VRLLLVGGGPLEESLREQARTLGIAGAVEFLGHQDRVEEILAEADVGVLPSTIEGLSNTLLEFMASGLPALNSTRGRSSPGSPSSATSPGSTCRRATGRCGRARPSSPRSSAKLRRRLAGRPNEGDRAMTIRLFYDRWPQYERRLVESIRDLTPDQLALRAAPEHWPVWAIASHVAGTRVYWLCDVLGEPGAATTPFADPNGGG